MHSWILLALIVYAFQPVVAAEYCPHGQLDPRYCDINGDMVADTPGQSDQWTDPGTIIFSYTPLEDPSVYAGVWDGFLKHLEEATGRRVRFFQVQSYAAQLEALRSGRLHVAGVNTGSNPIAVNCAGFVPFTMMAAADGTSGYEMEIIVPANSSIQTPKDLRGKTIAFSAPTSNSGFKAPSAILKSEYGLEASKDYKVVFSGKHDNSILGAVNSDYDAAAIANSVLSRMIDRSVFDPVRIRSIYKSETFPTTAYGYAHNLHPELADKIKKAFFTYTWAGSSLKQEFSDYDKFVPISYKSDWSIIRKIDDAMGVEYDCR